MLEKYIKNLIRKTFSNHPYFTSSIDANGNLDVKDFQNRYRKVLSENDTSLSDKEKKTLLSRAGMEGYQKTLDEIGTEMGKSRERIRQLEGKALRKLMDYSLRRERPQSYPYETSLDALYVKEFESATKGGASPRRFDVGYIKQVKSQADARIAEDEIKARKESVWEEGKAMAWANKGTGIQHLKFSYGTNLSLLREGFVTIDQLEKISDEDLLKVWKISKESLREIREKMDAYHKQLPIQPYEKDEDGLWALGLRTQTSNALRRAGVSTVSELEGKSDEELSKIRWLGALSLKDIREKLETYHKQKKP